MRIFPTPGLVHGCTLAGESESDERVIWALFKVFEQNETLADVRYTKAAGEKFFALEISERG